MMVNKMQQATQVTQATQQNTNTATSHKLSNRHPTYLGLPGKRALARSSRACASADEPWKVSMRANSSCGRNEGKEKCNEIVMRRELTRKEMANSSRRSTIIENRRKIGNKKNSSHVLEASM
jgi:hypothetical protein